MPELPEVETVRRGLAPAMEGKRILRVQTRRKDLRFPFPENFNHRIEGARLKHMGRRAKYLVAELSSGEALIMHLGMTGRFTVSGKKPGKFHHEAGDAEKHDHVVFDMQGGATVTFNDARRFGFMDLWPLADHRSLSALRRHGPRTHLQPVLRRLSQGSLFGKKAPVKAALLDQYVVAGLGNIYVCEALFRSGISPKKLAGAIKRDKLETLAVEIRKVIEEAIEAGGSTISDFETTTGELGYFQHRFQVYDREGDPCITCAKPVKRLVQSGRSTFYCGTCQK
jgi:formamidopyrimidine-DNA glycosylase